MSCKDDVYLISDASLAIPLLSRTGAARGKLPKVKELYEPMDESMTMGEPNFFSTVDEQSDMYRAFRKGLAPAFSVDHMRKTFFRVRACVDRMVVLWGEAAAKKEPVLLNDWMYRVTLDVITWAGLGEQLHALEAENHPFVEAMHANLVEMAKQFANPLRATVAKLLPFLPSARQIAHAKEATKGQFVALYQALKARGEPAAGDHTIAAHLMRIKNPRTGLPFKEKTMLANMAVIVIGGYDTTAVACLWALYDIARHPHVQRRLQEELKEAGLLQVQGQPPARQLQFEDLSTFPYFNSVLKEAIRMHPPATGVFRKASEDLEVGGYFIPKGAQVWVATYSLHMSPINFTRPEEFDPDRWADDAEGAAAAAGGGGKAGVGSGHRKAPPGVAVSASSGRGAGEGGAPAALPPVPGGPFTQHATPHGHAHAPYSMLAFSEGTRDCIGRNLAYMDMRTILLTVLSNFHIELDPSVASHKEVEDAQFLALVLNSGKEIRLQLQPHA